MELFARTQQKSRLGQILLDKRLVSQEQLSKAMEQQATTGERLGDILTQWNVVTQRHIDSALRAQRNLRLVASLVTAMMSPLITACGGGGGGGADQPAQAAQAQQISAAQRAANSANAAAVEAAAQNASTAVSATSEPSASSTVPSTMEWVIRESVCCAPVDTKATLLAAAPSIATPSATPTTQTAVPPSTTPTVASPPSTPTPSATPPTQTAVAPSTTPTVAVTPSTPTPAPPTTATLPALTTPTNLAAQTLNATRVALSWTDDSGGKAKYRIYRGNTPLDEVSGASYTDYTATASTAYTYQVRAIDINNDSNTSALSNVAAITTPAETTALGRCSAKRVA